MTNNDKTLKLDLPVTEYPDLTIFLCLAVGSATYDGWDIDITTTGKKLILDLVKDKKRIKQSIELGDLIGAWVEQIIKEED